MRFKFYLYFVTKHRQARHGISWNSFFYFDQGISSKILRYFSVIGENAVTSSIRIAQVFPELVGKKDARYMEG